VIPKSETKLSKNVLDSGTRQISTSAFPNKHRLALEPGKNIQPHAWGRTACLRVTNVARLHQPSTRICKILANCEHALSDCKESNGSNKISLLVKSCSIRACPERVQRVERVKQKSAKIGKFFAAFPQAGVSCTAREGIGSGAWRGKWDSSRRSPCTKATAPIRLIAPMKSFASAKIIAIRIVRDHHLGNPAARRADRRLSVCSLEPLRQAS
jgi:hypothetical protein